VAGRGRGPLGPHPGHDSYWLFRDLFFDAIGPAPGRLTLEVGCGEGRVARDLARRGHTVVALDASPTLTAMAAAADPGGRYVVGAAAALPFGDGCFDAVVAYNSLMDVADMPASVREASRVLAPGGRLCVCVTHPHRRRRQVRVQGARRPVRDPRRRLLIDRLREPPAPGRALTVRPGYERWQRLPNLLHVRAVKLP
jgi:ubiquinone/menaquinone biosynthesis C-methylase UbiE